MSGDAKSIDCLELFNLLQAQSNWPAGGAPALFDVRDKPKRLIRGALLHTDENEAMEAWHRSGRGGRDVCLYSDSPEGLSEHAVALAFGRDRKCRTLLLLSEPFAAFEKQFPYLCARSSSSKASKRPLVPSCIVPGLLYLGDLADAAALPRLREQLNLSVALTALAELPPSLKASVAESGISHTWCNVRDVEEANIKAHFETAYEKIEACRAEGSALFVHCSRGVSRSASLCIAYLMRKEGWTAQKARALVEERRPIVLPNEGFWKCLIEYGKELTGERTGVYAPMPKAASALEDAGFELPPEWAADPTLASGATLRVEKGGETVESLEVGEHEMYTFGRSLTCDFPLEHRSLSRQHAALVHHENGGLYVIDLKSSHGTHVNGKQIAPFEATLLRNDATLAFGASSRAYVVQGVTAPPPAATAGASSSDGATVAEGPMLPGEQRKRKYTPADAKLKKRQKWLSGPKTTSQMSENERVARGAGSGSGCFGPGFD